MNLFKVKATMEIWIEADEPEQAIEKACDELQNGIQYDCDNIRCECVDDYEPARVFSEEGCVEKHYINSNGDFIFAERVYSDGAVYTHGLLADGSYDFTDWEEV